MAKITVMAKLRIFVLPVFAEWVGRLWFATVRTEIHHKEIYERYILDGKRKIGPYQPDLGGWHNEVRTKLRRMRYETATIVSDIVREYNVGPFSRLLLELVPSAVIYSNMRRSQHGQNNYTVDQMSDAINELRDLDD